MATYYRITLIEELIVFTLCLLIVSRRNEMLKVGLIGLGGIARSHADAISNLDNVEIVAVADLFEDVRTDFMKKWDIPKGYKIPLDADYFHCTSNNTIYGTQIKKYVLEIPKSIVLSNGFLYYD